MKNLDITHRQVQLPVDNLERKMVSEIRDQVAPPLRLYLPQQPFNHRSNHRLAPLADLVGQEGFLEDLPVSHMLGRVHARDRLSETYPKIDLEKLARKDFGLREHLDTIFVTEDRKVAKVILCHSGVGCGHK